MQNVCTAHTHTRKSCVFHQQALVSLTPYSPRTLRTSPLPTHHPLYLVQHCRHRCSFIHPLSLSGRRCVAVAAQRRLPIMKNAACKKQKKKNAVGIETETNDMWNTASHRPKICAAAFYLSAVCVCVCVCVFCICIVFLLAILFCANLCRALLGRPQ